jgi:hypothetical protein
LGELGAFFCPLSLNCVAEMLAAQGACYLLANAPQTLNRQAINHFKFNKIDRFLVTGAKVVAAVRL